MHLRADGRRRTTNSAVTITVTDRMPGCCSNKLAVAMIVFKCLHGVAPSYLADDCVLASDVPGRRHLRSADTMNCHRRQRLCSFGRSHLEQSTSSFETVFLLSSDICTETENFLRQRVDVAQLRIICFALYKCTHYYLPPTKKRVRGFG